jgi:ADP-ribosylglycohydrolase
LEGLLIGDALGVPYEFHDAADLPPRSQIDFEPPAAFARAHVMTPPGTWSDDGAQALCLLATLLEHQRLEVAALARSFVAWYEHGYLAVDGVVFDVGVATAAALRAIAQGVDPLSAARCDERANGNGGLMRVLPLALWHRGRDAELVADAQLQTRITHGHPRSWVCSALYCLWARAELNGVDDAYRVALASLRALYRDEPGLSEELELHVRPDETGERGSGYVVDSLRSARTLLDRCHSYEEVVVSAVALGDDTDTTAAVAGGIAGVRWGIDAIPERWRSRLRGRDLLAPLMAGLLAHSAA